MKDGTTTDFPAWVPRLVVVPPVFFAIVSLTGAAETRPIIATAVGLAVAPWVLHAVGARSLPDPVFAAWVLLPIAVLNLAGGALGVDLSGESHNQFSLMILVWLVGEMAARGTPPVIAATVLGTVGVTVGRTLIEPAFGHSWTFWLGGAGIAFLTGYMLRRQQQTLSELRRTQAALAGDAARRERQRIAREVHDVVAHTLTVTLMHVNTARRAIDRDPAAVRDALEEAETLGRQSLADIRRTVGLLRAEGEAPDTHALPDASDLPALLDSYRSAGMELRADVVGDLGGLAPASSLTLYRIVQEALSNAAGHAAGEVVEIRVDVHGDDVEVTVSNAVGAPPGQRKGGLGVVGMRERIALLGGTLDAGVRDGRWSVSARFPRGSSETTVGVRS